MPLRRVTKRKIFDRTELRRWCIEKAMQWPKETVDYGYGGGAYGMSSVRREEDADVIGRAKKILDWLTE